MALFKWHTKGVLITFIDKEGVKVSLKATRNNYKQLITDIQNKGGIIKAVKQI